MLTNLENTRHTERINNLGEKYRTNPVYKTRMFIAELKGPYARVIWHYCQERKQLLFIDVYLKSTQDNHDINRIIEALDWHYKNP